MDRDEGVNDTGKSSEGSSDFEGKENVDIVENEQKTFGLECNSEMQQSGRTKEENFGKDSDAATDCELKTENLDCTNDLMDLRPEGPFETFQKTFSLEGNSGMQQSGRTEEENLGKDSDAIIDCELNTENLDCTYDLMDLRPEGSFEMFEAATEYERKFLQHRRNEELHFSDISSGSNDSVSSDKSSENIKTCKPESQLKCKVGEHSNSIPGFYDCDEHFSGFLAFNEVLRYHNSEIPIQESYEDITRQFNDILLKEASNENSSPDQNDSQKQRVSPEIASVPYHNSPQEGKMPLYRREEPHFYYSELLNLLNQISKKSGERKDMSQHSNVGNLDNAGSPEEKSYDSSDLGLYNMISSPISSKYIKTEYSPDSLNSRTDRMRMQMPVSNLSPITPDKLSNDNLSPTAQIDNSSVSKTDQTILSHSMELQSSSNNDSPKNYPNSISCSSCNSSVRNKSASCFDIPSSSKGPTHSPSKGICKPKYSGLLNFYESDSSDDDDTKGNFPKWKDNQARRKLFDSSDTRASYAENHQNVPENASSNDNLSPTAQVDYSSISKTDQAKLSRFMESHSSSNTHSPKNFPKSISCRISNSIVRNESTSCFDIPSSSKGPTQQPPSEAVYKPKCSRLLNFESDSSNDDDKKGNFSKGKENRTKRKLLDFSDTCSSDAENHPDVSENPSSSEFCSKKPRKNEENESPISVLRPLEIINSENLEANQSIRKRSFSNSKSSDIEQSDEESKSEKKPKLRTSSE